MTGQKLIKKIQTKLQNKELILVLILLLLSFIPVTWYQSDSFWAKGDALPFYLNEIDIISDNSLIQQDGNGQISSSPARFFYSIAFEASNKLGLEVGMFQVIEQILYLMISGLSIFYLAKKIWPKSDPNIYFLSALFYMFNVYSLQRRFYPTENWIIAFLPLLSLLYLVYLTKSHNSLLFSTIFILTSSIGLSLISLNPPLLPIILLALIGVIIYSKFFENVSLKTILAKNLIILIPMVLLNMWWMYSTYVNYIKSIGDTYTYGTETNILNWQWVNERANILNNLWFNITWAWEEQYYPFVHTYSSLPMKVLTFVPTLIVIFALYKNKSRKIIFLIGSILLFLFFAKALSAPFGEINRIIYDNIPGFFIFRDVRKFQPMIIFLFALAFGYSVIKIKSKISNSYYKGIFYAFSIISVLIISFPFFTGEIVRRATIDIPYDSYASIPEYWYETDRYLSAKNPEYSVLIMPQNEDYQVAYDWGFIGADNVPKRILNNKVVERQFSYTINPDYQTLIENLYSSIGDKQEFEIYSELLGINYILFRNDIDKEYQIESGHDIEFSIQKEFLDDNYEVNNIGELSLYEINPTDNSFKLRSSQNLLHTQSIEDYVVAKKLNLYSGDIFSLDPNIRGHNSYFSNLVDPENIEQRGTNLYTKVNLPYETNYKLIKSYNDSQTAWSSILQRDGDKIKLSLNLDTPDIAIDNRTINIGLESSESFELQGVEQDKSNVINIDENYYLFPKDRQSIKTKNILLNEDNNELDIKLFNSTDNIFRSDLDISNSPDKISDCNNAGGKTIDEAGISGTNNSDSGEYLRLEADFQSACFREDINIDVNEDELIRITFQTRNISGKSPKFCLLNSENKCIQLESINIENDGWNKIERYIEIDEKTNLKRFFLYSDGDNGNKTINDYKSFKVELFTDPTVTKVEDINSSLSEYNSSDNISLSSGEKEIIILDDIESVVIDQSNFEHDDEFLSTVNDCNRQSDRTLEEVGIKASSNYQDENDVLMLEAREHSACIKTRVSNMELGYTYRIEFDYKPIQGRSPRYCLYSNESGRCIDTDRLNDNQIGEWNSYKNVFTASTTDVSGEVYLYFYADGDYGDPTTILYDSVRIHKIPNNLLGSLFIQSDTSDTFEDNNNISYMKINNHQFKLFFGEDLKPRSLVVNNINYNKGWVLLSTNKNNDNLNLIDILNSKRIETDHLNVNGYANAWEISPESIDPDRDIQLVFIPQIIFLSLLKIALGTYTLITTLLMVNMIFKLSQQILRTIRKDEG